MKTPITKIGEQLLRDELQHLKHVERPAVITAISEARAQGDLSENAEYDAAREEQGLVETRIAEIEDILQNAQIIAATDNSQVHLGSTVELKLNDKILTYTVVGRIEANPLEGKISDESPIGQQLIGKKVGDAVTITTPKGELTYEVVKIS